MTQLRRNLTPALATLLHSGLQLAVADVYTITLSGGTVLRWTNADRAVSFGGNTWVTGPGLDRDTLVRQSGITTDEFNVTFTADANTTVNGVPLVAFILRGGFDGATLSLDKVYAPDPGMLGDSSFAWTGLLNDFTGDASDVQSKDIMQVQVTWRPQTERFNLQIPKNVYQPSCANTLFDGACLLDRSSFQDAVTATGATDGLRLTFASDSAQADGYFDLGAILFETGANAGLRRTVRTFAGGAFTMMQPLPNPVASGDTFTAWPGCDRTLNTCTSKFNNRIHFRGEPWIPAASTVF